MSKVGGILGAFLLLFSALLVTRADAATLEQGVAALGSKSFKARIAAVRELGASGDARAVPILEALMAGKLFTRKADWKTVIVEKSGAMYRLTDAVTSAGIGEAVKKELKKIRVNNRMRGVIRGVLGALTLRSEDAAKRIAAADAVFRSTSPNLIQSLEAALAREADNAVKTRLERALAAVTLTASKDIAARKAALVSLREFADPDVRSLLSRLAATDDPLAGKAASALIEIEERLAFWQSIGLIFQGISLGSVLLLAAVGLAITFGVLGVINMAHGELVMIGAYTTFMVQEGFRAWMPDAFDYSLFVAVPAAFAVAGAFGVAIERGIIRHLYGRPLETLLATWGISLILQQLVRSVFGPTNQDVSTPSWMSGAYESASGLVDGPR